MTAAQLQHLAGADGAAVEMLTAAELGPLDEAQRAEVDLLRAEIAFTERRGNDAPGLLLRAAQRLELLDPRTARATYLDALVAAHFAGRLAHGTGLREVAQARGAAPPRTPIAHRISCSTGWRPRSSTGMRRGHLSSSGQSVRSADQA